MCKCTKLPQRLLNNNNKKKVSAASLSGRHYRTLSQVEVPGMKGKRGCRGDTIAPYLKLKSPVMAVYLLRRTRTEHIDNLCISISDYDNLVLIILVLR